MQVTGHKKALECPIASQTSGMIIQPAWVCLYARNINTVSLFIYRYKGRQMPGLVLLPHCRPQQFHMLDISIRVGEGMRYH